jgi:hypothetical protein
MNRGWLTAAGGLLVGIVLIQLALGADVVTLALSLACALIGLYPILRIGFDLYTVFAGLFWLRYTGAALVAKTLYLQPVDSLLKSPVESYLLATTLIGVVTAVTLLARRLDTGGSVFPPLPATRDTRQLGLVAYLVGSAAAVLLGILGRRDADAANVGALFVVTHALISLTYLGYVSELVHTISESRGRRIASARLLGMLAVTISIALFLNVRAMAVNSVVCVFFCGLMFGAIKARHVALGAILGLIFTAYVSPVALELRTISYDTTAARFASEVVELIARTAAEPALIGELQQKESYRTRFESGTLQYDYYGDGSNILNRASFVALLDSVYTQVRVLNPIGVRAISEQVIPRNLPSFLVEKEARAYGYGDWLSWEIGLIETGRIAFLSFPVPVEGIAVLGPLIGVTVWPVLVMLPTLVIFGRLSSFRNATTTSLFLLSAFHWELIEAPSDGYIGLLTRGLPITLLPTWCLFWLWANQHQLSAGARPTARALAGPRARRDAIRAGRRGPSAGTA